MKLLKYSTLFRSIKANFSENSPVYVFHHIPKCGGSSLVDVLNDWFVVRRDYRDGWSMNYPVKFDLKKFRSGHCLVGHWELDQFHLHQRYPEIKSDDRFRIFTFLRDPLEVQLSLFRYEKKYGVNSTNSIEEHLMLRPNYLASIFPLSEHNYKTVLDKYFFIGLLERPQESLDLLSKIIDKPKATLPILNATKRDGRITEILSAEQVQKFHQDNRLDYLIYEYAVNRFDGLFRQYS